MRLSICDKEPSLLPPSESSPGRILDCDMRRAFTFSPIQRLNHLQGEYWIATPLKARISECPASESSPGRILDCDYQFRARSGDVNPSESSPGRILDCDPTKIPNIIEIGIVASESSPGRILDCDVFLRSFLTTKYRLCLNHLQGEYWIATI